MDGVVDLLPYVALAIELELAATSPIPTTSPTACPGRTVVPLHLPEYLSMHNFPQSPW